MKTATEFFISLFYDRFIGKFETRKEAYEATCDYWRRHYEFQEPITSYESFRRMLTYYDGGRGRKKKKKVGIVKYGKG